MLPSPVHELRYVAQRILEAQLREGRDFGLLWEQMGESDERVAAESRDYNDSVHALNSRIVAFPSNIVAGVGKVGRAQYFLPGGRAR